MKLVLISDTHEKHEQLDLPEGDVLVHAGDFSMLGQEDYVRKFGEWVRKQTERFQHVVFIAGNHDLSFEKDTHVDRYVYLVVGGLDHKIHYLQDSSVTINGVNFYGSPWTPTFGYGWAFNANSEKMKEVCEKIPNNTDVLITHGPPKYVLDKTLSGEHAGCPHLSRAIELVKPKVHVFGHIHEGNGYQDHNYTKLFNASVLNFSYQLVNKPFVVEL